MPSWTDSEPGARALFFHARRLVRRARRRPFVLALLLAAGCLGALALVALRPALYRAQAVVRVTEGARDRLSQRDWSNRSLRGTLTEPAFSSARLLEVIRRHGLAGPRFDPVTAVDDLKAAVEVSVVQNHVIALLEPQTRPRSAHLVITFAHRDRPTALAVVKDLAALVAAAGQSRRREDALLLARQADEAAAAARDSLVRLRARAVAMAPRSLVDERRQSQELRLAERRASEMEEARAIAEERVRIEEAHSGFELAALEPTVASPLPPRTRLLLAGPGAALILLPLVCFVVGAADRRIYDRDDVLVLGQRFLGQLRPPGDPLPGS